MPSYLQLCLRTWQRQLPWPVVLLDHGNLPEYGVLDIASLSRFHPQLQKDAIMAAVLERNGGIFLDCDTIVFRGLSELTAPLARSELVLFSLYLGSAAARAHGRVVSEWLEEVRRRLGEPRDSPRWDYLGNEIVQEILQRGVDESHAIRAISRFPFASGARRFRWRREYATASPLRRLALTSVRKIRSAVLKFAMRDAITILPPFRIVTEERVLARRGMTPGERYQKFWFEGAGTLRDVISPDPALVYLHHSYTPAWYSALSEEEVLAHPCLLSETLRHALRE